MLKVLGRTSFCLLFALASCGDPGHANPKSTPSAPAPTSPGVQPQSIKGVQFIEFHAPWCGPCKIQRPIVEKLEKNFPSVRFQYIDVDENESLAGQHNVRSIPCMVISVDGQEKARLVGLHDYGALAAKLAEAGVSMAGEEKKGDSGSAVSSASPRIAAKVDAELSPQANLKYQIVGPWIFKTAAPGPAEAATGTAWSLANEFVYRTALAKKYAVPASSVTPDGDNFKAMFRSLGSEKEITVEIDTKARTVTLKN